MRKALSVLSVVFLLLPPLSGCGIPMHDEIKGEALPPPPFVSRTQGEEAENGIDFFLKSVYNNGEQPLGGLSQTKKAAIDSLLL